MDEVNNFIRLYSSRNRGTIDKHNGILGMQENPTTPIAKLPVEIMTRIFYLLARSTAEDRWNLEKESWDWLELTKVCRSWRDMALECSILWSEIRPSFSKKRVEVFLERSGQAALDIELGDRRKIYTVQLDVLELISRHMNQVQNLRISVMERESAKWDAIQDLFQAPAPRLIELDLQVIADESNADDNFSSSVQLMKLASFVSVSIIPFRLESLSLSGVTLPWSSHIFEGLLSLRLDNIGEARYRPTLSEFLAILESSPRLRALDICNAGPLLSKICHQSVALPELEKLSISDTEHIVLVELFNNLVIPKNVGWCIIDLLNPFTVSEQFPDSLLNRSTNCHTLNIILYDYSITIYPEFYDVDLDESDTENQSAYSDSDEDEMDNYIYPFHPRMRLDLNDEHAASLPDGFYSFFQSLKPLFEHPFFKDVISLEIDLIYLENRGKIASLTATVWTQIFTRLPKMRTLSIQFHEEKNTRLETHIIEALADTKNGNILSELETIILNSARFLTKAGHRAFETLLSYLIYRRQNGRRLKHLELQECYGIGKKEIKRMRDLDVAEEIVNNNGD